MATYTDAIQKLYVAYFSRPADPAGLAYWEGVVTAAKGDTSAVSAAFAASTEYQTEYAQITTAGVITKIYQNLFGVVTPDAAGLAYWIDAINNKVFTIDQAVTKIAAGAQGTDKVAYDQKVLVATSFTAAVDTDAEKAGYNGKGANDAAKAFLATVKTAADAEAALKVLDTKVADVIKAGVPFTVAGALKALAAAQTAEAAFLKAEAATKATLEKALTDADAAVSGKTAGYDADASAGFKDAVLADQKDANAKALATAQEAAGVANAAAAKIPGLMVAIAAAKAADDADIAAKLVVTNAGIDQNTAVLKYNAANTAVLPAISPKGEVTDLIKLDTDGKTLVLVKDVTEKTNPGITAVLKAVVAKFAADKAASDAAAVKVDAHEILSLTDVVHSTALDTALKAVGAVMTVVTIEKGGMPTGAQIVAEIKGLTALKDAAIAAKAALPADATQAQKDAADLKVVDTTKALVDFTDKDLGNGKLAAFKALDIKDDLSDAVALKAGEVKTVNDSIKALADAVAALDAAKANVAEYTGLHKAVTDAEQVFVTNKLAVPVTLTTYNVGTSADDIFVAGKVNSTVTDMSKTDKLFIGADYVLNTGDLKAGNNAALEIFLKQAGANTEVTVETKAYGSESHDTITIVLVGVNATDVHFDGGIVTV